MPFRRPKIAKHFVSDLDRLLWEFDKTHDKTPAQLAEIMKYKKINELRDHPQPEEPVRPYLWDEETF